MARSERDRSSPGTPLQSGTFSRQEMLVVRIETVSAQISDELPESSRKLLLAELCDVLGDEQLSDDQRLSALEVAGRLARRTLTDPACQRGLCEMLRQMGERRSG